MSAERDALQAARLLASGAIRPDNVSAEGVVEMAKLLVASHAKAETADDLKARLKAVRVRACRSDASPWCHKDVRRITDLRVKNWKENR